MRWFGALLVAGIVGGVTAPALPASSQPRSTSQPAAEPTIRLVDQTTWVRSGEELRLRFDVDGVPADATINMVVHEQVESRGSFNETLTNPTALGGVEDPGVSAPIAGLRAADGTVQLARLVGDGGIVLATHGVYPVEVVVSDAAGTPLTSLVTYLLYVPDSIDQFPKLSVATIVDVGAAPALKPDGAVQLDGTALQEIQHRIEALTDAREVPLSIAPVPETIDGLEGSGAGGIQIVDNLDYAINNREVLARPYVDLDLDSMVEAGLLTELPPEAEAGAQVIRGNLVCQPAGGCEPTGGIWLAGATADSGDATALRELGIPRVVVPSSTIHAVEQPEGPVPTAPVSLGDDGPTALVSDDSLAVRLAGTDGRLDAQRFLAELMTIWGARPAITRGVTVRLPTSADVDPQVVGKALQGVAAGGVLQPVDVSQMFQQFASENGERPETVEMTDEVPDAQLDGLADRLHHAQASLNGLAGMLDDSQTIVSLQRSLLVALGTETPDEERKAYIDRINLVATQVRNSIAAPERFQITLTAREGDVPLTIDNAGTAPVSLTVNLSSGQMSFPNGPTINVVAQPGRTNVDIRVRTRTSGAMPLRIRLTSPDGTILLETSNYTVRSTAVSGVGLVLSIGAGLFLLIWWARHWRTTRRSQRLVERASHPTSR